MLIRSLVFVLSLLVTFSAIAGGKTFEAKSFEAAQAQGKSILLMVHASWCPTCRAQAPIVEKLSKTSEFAGYEIFRIDYDEQEDAVRRFRARYQSVLIVFKGDKEKARSIGLTREEPIAEQLRKGL